MTTLATAKVIKGTDGRLGISVDPQRGVRLAKIEMLKTFRWFGYLAIQMPVIIVEPDHPYLRTAATDGLNLYVNPLFFELVGRDGAVFVVAHEVLHCVCLHLDRIGNRKLKVWNEATDFAINLIATDAGLHMPTYGDLQNALAKMKRMCGEAPEVEEGTMVTDPAKIVGLLNKKYRGWSAEQIYLDLMNDPTSEGRSIDQHVAPGEGGWGGYTPIRRMPTRGPERERLARAWKQRANEARAAVGSDVPSGIRRLLDELNEPRIGWRDVLPMKIASPNLGLHDWRRPNKRHFGRGITLPSLKTVNHLRRVLIFDTSASVTKEMVTDFISEVLGIASQFDSWELMCVSHDTRVYNPVVYTSESPDEIFDYEILGSGGTWFRPVLGFMLGEVDAIMPDGSPQGFESFGFTRDFLWFTDGGCGDGWQEDLAGEFPDAIWLLTTPQVVAPWGTSLNYDMWS